MSSSSAASPAQYAASSDAHCAVQHRIRPEHIGAGARDVVQTLHRKGYPTYVVGGSIRDLLLGRTPKDFDIATSARPEQITPLFRRARRIGRRFPIVHVRTGKDAKSIIEVTTFRGAAPPSSDAAPASRQQRAQAPGANRNYGRSVKEDARRRDFTVNALYYAPHKERLWDYHGGLEDLEKRRLRVIGDPRRHYHEDPVRMLRAAHFSAKLDFALEPDSASPIPELAHLLGEVPQRRLQGEVGKIFGSGHGLTSFACLQRLDLFAQLFPATARSFSRDAGAESFVRGGLRIIDQRTQSGEKIDAWLLYAMLLWPALVCALPQSNGALHASRDQLEQAGSQLLNGQLRINKMPRRFFIPLREIWLLQTKLPKISDAAHATRLWQSDYCTVASELLEIRAAQEQDAALQKAAAWWRQFRRDHPPPRRERSHSQSWRKHSAHGRRRDKSSQLQPRTPRRSAVARRVGP